MKLRHAIAVSIACALAGCSRLPAPEMTLSAQSDTSPQRILITIHEDSGTNLAILGDPGSFYLRRRDYGPTPRVDRLLDEIARDYGIRRVEGWYIATLAEYCEVFQARPGQNADEIVRQISADPRIELVQLMNYFETEAIVYNDPFASMQPALTELAIGQAHELATGRGVKIAVVDSGVDKRHPELRASIRADRDLVDARAARGGELHGTAVAGIIGSKANNSEGIVGIAPDATIVPLRACWTVDAVSGRARCSSLSLALALEAAIREPVDVINLSLAGPPDDLLAALIDAAIASDIIVVAAQAASTDTGHTFPASHPLVIAAESSEATARAAARNLLRAPGREIMSTAPNSSYAFFSGNSMSAAYISGVSALVRERRPDISVDRLVQLLADSSLDSIVNACRAVTRAAPIEFTCAPGGD
jgi:hypothetical protein